MPQNDNVMDVTWDPEKKVEIPEMVRFRQDWKTSFHALQRPNDYAGDLTGLLYIYSNAEGMVNGWHTIF
jgi:hypothetical protein